MAVTPNVGQKTFQFATIVAPFLVPVLIELQRQLAGKALDVWTLASLVTGAIVGIVVAVFNVQRTATVKAEGKAEVATGKDQDEDKLVEQTPSQVRGQ